MKKITKIVKNSDFLLDRTKNSTRNQGSHLGLLSYLTDRSKSVTKTSGHVHTTLGQLAIKSQMPRKFLSESLRLFEQIGLVDITRHLGANQYWDIFPTPQATHALELLQTNHNVDLLVHFNVLTPKPIELIETKQPAESKAHKKSAKKSKAKNSSKNFAKNKARKKLKKQKAKVMSRTARARSKSKSKKQSNLYNTYFKLMYENVALSCASKSGSPEHMQFFEKNIEIFNNLFIFNIINYSIRKLRSLCRKISEINRLFAYGLCRTIVTTDAADTQETKTEVSAVVESHEDLIASEPDVVDEPIINDDDWVDAFDDLDDYSSYYYSESENVQKLKTLSYAEWLAADIEYIKSQLIEAGIAFIMEHAQTTRQLFNLVLDGKWHYLDKEKRQGYCATFDNQQIPYLKLTYHSFKDGGYSISFDNKAALKNLWLQSLGIKTSTPTTKPRLQIIAEVPTVDTIDYKNMALNTWDSLQLSGNSNYLQNKGLADFNLAGIRFSQNSIAVKIIDINNNFYGIQTIYDDGRKIFNKGLEKKGHFVLIGLKEMPISIKIINICEGVATAASIAMSIKQPVFAALDAFNLESVAFELKSAYPKAEIIIWADDDAKKAQKILANGKFLGNTGFIYAHHTAHKVGAMVCVPDFSSLKDTEHNATDFNDLHQLSGLQAIRDTIPQKPDLNIALLHALIKHNDYALGVLSTKNFKDATRINYNNKYLPEIDFSEGVHLVRSPIGSGKTDNIKSFLGKNPQHKALYITHLVALIEDAVARLNLVNYNDCDIHDLHIEDQLAICLNSLHKFSALNMIPLYDVVIVDEVEQVLARLTTNMANKVLVFKVLQHIMNSAKILICLDAHLSKTTADFIKTLSSDKKINIHINHYTDPKKSKYVSYQNAESLQFAGMQAIEDNKKAYISFNSKAEAFKTYSAFKAAFPEKRGLYISSDNAGDAKVKAFLKNVNVEVLNYDYVICTPSISTGVSIDVIHFDFVGGIFKASINTANDCMQALGRVRTASERHVFCELRHSNLSLDPDTIKARWCETHQYDLALMNLDNNQARVIINADYEALCLSVTLAHNRSLNNFAENFMILALADGAEIVHAGINVTKTVAKDFRSLKKALVQSEADNIGDAAIAKSCEELRKLMNKSRKTMEESRSISKKNIIDFYNLNVHDKDSITALASIDNEGRFKKAILNLELALSDEQYARNKFLAQTKNSEQFAADVRHYASIQELYKFALDTVSLNSNLDKNNYNYSADNLINSGFVAYIEEHRDVLKGLINLPSVSQLLADPVRFLGTLLGSMGIKQHRTGRSEKGMYRINNERLDLLKSLLAKRRLGSMATGTILDVSSIAVKKSTTMIMIIEYIDGIKSLFSPKTQIFSDFCTP